MDPLWKLSCSLKKFPQKRVESRRRKDSGNYIEKNTQERFYENDIFKFLTDNVKENKYLCLYMCCLQILMHSWAEIGCKRASRDMLVCLLPHFCNSDINLKWNMKKIRDWPHQHSIFALRNLTDKKTQNEFWCKYLIETLNVIWKPFFSLIWK